METKPTNTNAHCRGEHELEPSLYEAGVEACRWCPFTREAPAEVRLGVDVPAGSVVMRAARAA